MKAESIKAIAETVALASAAGFFGYKVYIGYFFPDLSLSLSSSRSYSTSDMAILVLTAKLKKGGHGSVRIHDMQARVTYGDQVQTTAFVGFNRMSYCTAPLGDEDDRKVVNWSRISCSAPLLRLPPGEETEFSCFLRVPKDSVCVIEVAVIGRARRRFCRVAQWKASHVAVPPKSLTRR